MTVTEIRLLQLLHRRRHPLRRLHRHRRLRPTRRSRWSGSWSRKAATTRASQSRSESVTLPALTPAPCEAACLLPGTPLCFAGIQFFVDRPSSSGCCAVRLRAGLIRSNDNYGPTGWTSAERNGDADLDERGYEGPKGCCHGAGFACVSLINEGARSSMLRMRCADWPALRSVMAPVAIASMVPLRLRESAGANPS